MEEQTSIVETTQGVTKKFAVDERQISQRLIRAYNVCPFIRQVFRGDIYIFYTALSSHLSERPLNVKQS